MKKFTLLLATMLLSVMSYAADEVYKTALFGSSYNSKGVQNYTSTWSATNNGFTVDIANANNNNNGWEYIKMGSKSAASIGTITTNVAIDEAITKVVLTIDAVTANSINSVKLKTSPDSKTWTEAGSFTAATGAQTVVLANPTANLYYQVVADCKKSSNGLITISKVEYCKAAPVAAVADPIISADDDNGAIANNGFYTNYLLVNITCETEGAAIRYTLDGTEPTSESALYDGSGIDFTNEFVTLRAKAFKGEDASYEATANYYHNSSLEVPYTTTQAVALYNALGDVENVFVEGSVDGNPTYYESSSSSNYNITDGTTSLYMFSGKAGDGCGLADIANLVQGDKVVVKGKLTAYNSPQLGAGNIIVKWTENTNPVLTCAESIAFGNISTLVGTIPSKTLKVTAKNLTEDITVTLSTDAAFTLDNTNFDVRNGGSIEITPVLTVGENTATLTLTSGEKTVTVTLTATIQQAYTISWSVNGKVTSTSAVIKGENLVLPASPEAPNDCASKVFVGWATTATVAANGTDIVFVDASTTATADATYYAVFATATESGETVTTYEKLTSTENFEDGTYLLVGYVASSTKYYAYTGKVTDKNYAGVADITVANDVISEKPETVLELTITTNAEGKFSIYDGTYWLSAPSANELTFNTTNTIDWSLTDKLKIQSVGQTNRFLQFNGSTNPKRFACYLSTSNQSDPYLFKKVVTSVMAYSDYATTCDDTPSAIDNAAVEIPAVKTIENGQLIILRDGKKYNAMGVRLQ